jgi:cytochrome c5
MSDTHESHTGPIKTPQQLLWTSFFAFVVPVIIIIGLVYYVTRDAKPAAGAVNQELALAQRIQRVGSVELKPAGSGAARTGEEVYKAVCAGCHAAGSLGSPKFGEAGAWGPRLGQGLQGLVNAAIKGKNAMPAQGGGDASDLEITRAVVYMANAAGGKFAEPKAESPAAK